MTLREYLDSLPEVSQKWLEANCKFIDVNSKDGYKHKEPMLDVIQKRLADSNYHREISEEDVIFSMLLSRNSKGEYVYSNGNDLSTDERNELIYSLLYNKHGSNMLDYSETYYLPLGYIRLAAKKAIQRYQEDESEENKDKLELNDLLLFTDDFSNIDWSKLRLNSWMTVTTGLLGILPKDIAKKYLLCRPTALDINHIPMDCDVFDELFFGEDGWSERQKHDVIGKIEHSEQGVANFMQRIVAVEKKYLREIYDLICYSYNQNVNKSFSNSLYCLKKPTEELNNCPKKYQYRYSDEYRKLFWIARCCYLGYTNRTAVSKMKDAGSLLKLYGYNFNNIFDILYPEYATQQPTVEE